MQVEEGRWGRIEARRVPVARSGLGRGERSPHQGIVRFAALRPSRGGPNRTVVRRSDLIGGGRCPEVPAVTPSWNWWGLALAAGPTDPRRSAVAARSGS